MFNNKPGFLITGRLKSKRLPRKVILEVKGRPLICHMLDRIKAAKRIGEIVICTSTNPQDDPFHEIAQREGVSCYRGSEDDVLMRLLEAASEHGLDYFVNITADCPLIDPLFINRTVDEYERTHADLVRFDLLPRGQGPNGIKVSALKKVCEIKAETETEVWGDYFTRSGLFTFHSPQVEDIYLHPTLKTSIDYPEDYEFLKRIFDELYVSGVIFSLLDVINLVNRKPELLAINSHCINMGVEHISKTKEIAFRG
jgi:spore coat polysaccharide biosynthesis protein SpsF